MARPALIPPALTGPLAPLALPTATRLPRTAGCEDARHPMLTVPVKRGVSLLRRPPRRLGDLEVTALGLVTL